MIANIEKAIVKSHLDQEKFEEYYDDSYDFSEYEYSDSDWEFDTEDWSYDEDNS